MEELTNKQKKSYSYTSRYSSFYIAYHKDDDKWMHLKTSNLDDTTSYIIHYLKEEDTLDYLANKYYGRPDYYWVIADFNRIQDAFENIYLHHKYLKIPTLTNIKYL